ncbi:MAG: hypothetical protein E7321_05470 [Clostridiales bacterium]|nr:hypothetical protein [Clostridiales bacterium]
MAENRITKSWLKNHWAYSWWKYLLLAGICIMGVNLLFTATAYRAPEHKKIELYVCNGYVDQQVMQQEMTDIFFARHPDQEELTVMNINLAQGDMYIQMQFTTYLAAQQGDVLLLPQSEVYKLTEGGADNAFMDLTPYIESGVIDLDAIGAGALTLKDSAGEEGIYAIEADSLYGLTELGNAPEGSYLCVTGFSGNEDTAAAVVGLMFDLYQAERPEDYDEKYNSTNSTALF